MTKKIVVIGAGTMGNGIAHVFAQNGFSVTLTDVSPDALTRAMNNVSKNLDRMVAKGTIDANAKDSTLKNISTEPLKGPEPFKSLSENVKPEIVVEAATENAELKFKIFRELDQFTDANTILAS